MGFAHWSHLLAQCPVCGGPVVTGLAESSPVVPYVRYEGICCAQRVIAEVSSLPLRLTGLTLLVA
jgi:hypothetical protein